MAGAQRAGWGVREIRPDERGPGPKEHEKPHEVGHSSTGTRESSMGLY